MLPSHGLLKSFACPYYISGFCERPHCLFRHEKKDIFQALKAAPVLLSSYDDYRDDADVSFSSKENKCDSSSSRRGYSLSHKKSDHAISSFSSSKETSVAPKAYVTPLNESLPLPVPLSKREDIKPSADSKKRVSVEVADSGWKRRKISETETVTNSKNDNLNDLPLDSNSIKKASTVVSDTKKKQNIALKSQSTPPEKEADAKTNDTFPQKSENELCKTASVRVEKRSLGSTSCESSDKTSSNGSKEKLSSSSSRAPKERNSSTSSKKDDERKSRHKDSRSDKKSSDKSSHGSSRSHSSTQSHKSKHSEKSKERSDSKHHKSSSTSSRSSDSKRSEKYSSSGKSKSSSSSSHRSSSRRSSDKSHQSSSQRDKEKKEKIENSASQGSLFADLDPTDSLDVPEEFRFPDCSDSDDDPEEVAMECLRMFEDYTADEPSNAQNMSALNATFEVSDSTEGDLTIGKKRMAHSGAEQRSFALSSQNSFKSIPKVTHSELQKTMLQRAQAAMEAQKKSAENSNHQKDREEVGSNKSQSNVKLGSTLKTISNSVAASSKRRIAHVSNVSLLMKPNTPTVTPSNSKGFGTSPNKEALKPTPEVSTVAQTNIKGQGRIAHSSSKVFTPSNELQITLDSAIINTKVPLAFRQKILLQMYQECLKLLPDSEAADRARKEEAEVAGRCTSKMVYFSAATNAITRLRKGLSSDSSNSGSNNNATTKLAGSAGLKKSWSIETANKRSFKLPSGPNLFQILKKFVLKEDELDIHGYPLPHSSGEPGRAVSKRRRKADHKPAVNGIPNPTSRHCERCSKPYRTDADGMPLIIEKCDYHFGRRFNRKNKGLVESRYTCCDGEATSEGCSVARTHVSTLPGSEDDLKGFVAAVKEPGEESGMGISIWDIVALDCEMVYTTVGSELARVTIVDCHKKILYDQLVIPPHPVLDYNTRFSGLTEEIMLQGPTVSLIQVQAVLLTQLKPNSILIGHSLESDLHALKLIHRTVIDTSVLFPHRLGLPFKRALRTLSAEYCGQIIQSSVNGHNSSEDALAALDLVFYKLKELG